MWERMDLCPINREMSGFRPLASSTRPRFRYWLLGFLGHFCLFPWFQTFLWCRFLNYFYKNLFAQVTKNFSKISKKNTWEVCEDCDDWLPLDESRFRFRGDDLLFSFSSSIDILAIGLSSLVDSGFPRFWLVDFSGWPRGDALDGTSFFDLFLGANRAGDVFFGDSSFFAVCLFETCEGGFLPFVTSEVSTETDAGFCLLLLVLLLVDGLVFFRFAVEMRSFSSASFSRSLSSVESSVLSSTGFFPAVFDFWFCFWLSLVPSNIF